jgi:hypothetical protein
MTLVNGYSESVPTQQTKQFDHARPNSAVIRDFLDWLHRLADGLDGELALVAIEQKPDAAKAQVRSACWRQPGEMKAALRRPESDWEPLFRQLRGSLPARANSRGSREDIIGVLMPGKDQDDGQEGTLPLNPTSCPDLADPKRQSSGLYVFDPENRSPSEADL